MRLCVGRHPGANECQRPFRSWHETGVLVCPLYCRMSEDPFRKSGPIDFQPDQNLQSVRTWRQIQSTFESSSVKCTCCSSIGNHSPALASGIPAAARLRPPTGDALLGRARIAAERNGHDVPADERLPRGPMAEADPRERPPVGLRGPRSAAVNLARGRSKVDRSALTRQCKSSVNHTWPMQFERGLGTDLAAKGTFR